MTKFQNLKKKKKKRAVDINSLEKSIKNVILDWLILKINVVNIILLIGYTPFYRTVPPQ